MTDEALDTSDNDSTFTKGQLVWLGVQLVAVVAVGVFVWVRNPDYASLLWTDSLGIKMSVGSLVLLAAGTMLYLVGCAYLNELFARRGTARAFLLGLLRYSFVAVCFVVFFLPATFTMLVGPAAIQIQRQMLK
jgi:hypothetical protein